MPIGNGGIIGPNNVPSLTSAKGVWSIQEAMLAQRAGTWPLPTPDNVDPYFYSVTSLLHGDGTNGGQNNTFLDSSTNNFTITRNGNTTQGSFSPFSQTGWGNYFNGTDAYLQTPANSALTPSTSTTPFTLEAWIYPTSSTTGNCIITQTLGTGIRYSLALGSAFPNLGDGLKVWLGYFTGISWSGLTSSSSVSLNTWTHVAAVFTGSTCKIFINGVEDASGGPSTWTTAAASNVVLVGRRWDTFATPYYFQGYISNARVVIGTAVYTSAFTPSTTPLTAITNTQLLTCQSNRFLDNSSNAFAITVNGSPSVQPFSPFNPTTAYSTSAVGGSGYFDGSGDYLTAAGSASLTFGTGDFTVEGWFYTASPATNMGLFQISTTAGGLEAGNTNNVAVYCSSSVLGVYYNDTFKAGTTAIRGSAWTHFALVRSSGTDKLYVNGVADAGFGSSADTRNYTGGNIAVGGYFSASYLWNGYISGFRVVKGTAVYTTDFTPPTAPPTAITNTQLLCNFTNGAIFDNAAVADYETVGNAQINTSVKKYGTGSIAFDGTGDWLVSPASLNWDFGSGDFTIELWINPSATTAGEALVSKGNASSTGNEVWTLQWYGTNQLAFFSGGGLVTPVVNTGSVFATGNWYHVAVCRAAGVTKIFVNGTVQGTSTTSYTITAGGALYVGAGWYAPASRDISGYIDDLRISKGVARYLYNFTPPTAEFPNIGGTVTLTADPYFDYTTLLLPGNGTNGAQNNTFLDSSSNAFTITRNGNTTQGTFSPFSQTGWGNYFDGSGDYLETPSNAAFTLGSSGDFTVECWVYATATPGNYAAFMTTWADANTGYPNRWFIGVHDSKIKWYNDAGASAIAASSNIQLNTWLHVAAVRSGSTITLYINGTAIGTQTTSQSYTTQGTVKLGYSGTGGNYFYGYISNARVVKGTAVYTANFTPPTAPLTAITNTSLLTCQSNRFIDNSTNAFAITRNGDVSVQAFSPFNPTASWSAATNGGSGYFDGSGDFVYPADNSAFAYGTGDFTVEAWVYPSSLPGSGSNVIIDQRESTPSGGGFSLEFTSTGRLDIATSTVVLSSSSNLTPNQWQHVAMARSGSTLKLFINGAEVGSTSNSTNLTSQRVTVGAYTSRVAASSYFVGYINGVRLVKGTAVYTAAFTPPTAPLTAITNTSLLLNYTNAGIYDATSKNDLETVGNAQISTTQSKFGGSSMYFDGTGDWLAIPATQNIVFGTADFTIEMWVYSGAQSGTGVRMMGNGAGGSWASGKYILTTTTAANPNKFTFGVNNTSPVDLLVSTTTFNDSTWRHVAITRYGNVFRLFVNGIQESTNTSSASVDNGTAVQIRIGSGGISGDADWAGYIDDLRITKGIARYTSNFTPPTTAFLTL